MSEEVLQQHVRFDPQQASAKEMYDGYAYAWRFDNGIGVSVIRHNGSYGHEQGLFEMMISQPTEFKHLLPIDLKKDVRGFMTEKQVNATLKYLQSL